LAKSKLAEEPKLAEYEAKRDFARTGEPRGRGAAAAAPKLRFVIQKHDATRLHYDFRLELDGVFKSWAVTTSPSLDPPPGGGPRFRADPFRLSIIKVANGR
jgi:hypothetical protein